MKIIEQRLLRGPNLHSMRPCMRVVIDLEELDDVSSTAIPDFTDRLCAVLPTLHEHRCSPGYPGGFVERLREGTYMAHVIEHVTIELQCVSGSYVAFGRARMIPDTPRHYSIVVAYRVEQLVTEAFAVAVRMIEALARGELPDIAPDLAHLAAVHDRYAPGPSTRAILEAARERGIPTLRLTDEMNLYQLGWGRRQQRIQATVTGTTRYVGVDVASDKHLTKQLLAESGIPVPQGELVETPEAAIAAARRIGGPVAVKPLDANQGKGVRVGLVNPDEIAAAFVAAAQFCPMVIVERHVTGFDYRILVVGDKAVAAAWRVPPTVIGDGTSTVRDLVLRENANPLRGDGHGKPLSLIPMDAHAEEVLAQQGVHWDSVPQPGAAVRLRGNGNLSTGGTAEDVTDRMHPDVARACVRAAMKVGLDVAGIDLVCDDISRPLAETRGAIVEVNAAPGIRMHEHPSRGMPRRAGAAIVDALFPEGANGRVPLIAVTGTNGKTTTTLVIAHTIRGTGVTTGVTTTEGVYIDGERILSGDCTGYWSARALLTSPEVEAIVLETARGGILRRGLAFDRSDVAVVLNVQDDHLGQDFLRTVDDLAKVKETVALTATNAVILNAEDPRCVRMAKSVREGPHPEVEVLYFALDGANPVLAQHLQRGGRGMYVSRGMLVLGNGEMRIPLIEAERIPFTLGGRARHNVANALAAAGALWAAGYRANQIVAGLTTFTSDVEQNPLRMNLFRAGDRILMLDYAHNAPSYDAIIGTARALTEGRVLALVAAPGDRSDAQLREIGALCAQRVDRLFIFEMQDRRGREHGETASLLEEGAESSGAMTPITVAADFDAAFRQAYDECQPGDLLLIGCADETHDLLRVAPNAVPISPDSLPATGALRVPAPRRSAGSVAAAPLPSADVSGNVREQRQ